MLLDYRRISRSRFEEIIEKWLVKFEVARNKINIEPGVASLSGAHARVRAHTASSSGNIQWKGFVPLTWQPVPVKRREMDRRYMRFNQYVGITSRVRTTRLKTTRRFVGRRVVEEVHTCTRSAGQPACRRKLLLSRLPYPSRLISLSLVLCTRINPVTWNVAQGWKIVSRFCKNSLWWMKRLGSNSFSSLKLLLSLKNFKSFC